MKKISVAGLGDTGNPAAAPLFTAILNDESAPDYLRREAADALGRLQMSGAKNVDYPAIISGLNKLMLDGLSSQLKALSHYIEENPGERMRPQGGLDEMEQPEHPMVLRVRRILQTYIYSVSNGLEGLSKGDADPNVKNKLTAMISELMSLSKELKTEELMPAELMEKITPPALRIEELAK